MENVFADLGTTIITHYSDEKKTQINRRHAFVFVTAEPDSDKSAVEDLKKVKGALSFILPVELTIL